VALLADVIAANRRLLEEIRYRQSVLHDDIKTMDTQKAPARPVEAPTVLKQREELERKVRVACR